MYIPSIYIKIIQKIIRSSSSNVNMSGALSISVLLIVQVIAYGYTNAACPTIITRSEWGARSATGRVSSLTTNPAPFVVIHHAASSSCTNQAICQAKVRGFQNDHINSRQWTDIGYNFLVGEDGNVYEGRGWDKRGAHTVSYNSKSIGICFIGNFVNRQPSVAAVNAAKNLIQCGIDLGKIKDSYGLLGHRQAAQTNCPGTQLFELIKTWPRWIANPSH